MANKHFNPNSEPSLRDTLSFSTGEKDYSVVHLTDETMARISELSEDASLTPGESLSHQLAAFTGAEPSEFSHLDFRIKAAIISWITEQVTDPLGNRKQRRDAKK